MGWLRHVIAGQCCQARDSAGGFQSMLNMMFTTLEVLSSHSVAYGLQFDRMLRTRLSRARRDGNERLASRLLQLVRSPTAAEVAGWPRHQLPLQRRSHGFRLRTAPSARASRARERLPLRQLPKTAASARLRGEKLPAIALATRIADRLTTSTRAPRATFLARARRRGAHRAPRRWPRYASRLSALRGRRGSRINTIRL